VRVVGHDTGIGLLTADGIEAADPGGHGALAARMETHVAGGASCAPADSRGDKVCDLWFDYLASYGIPGHALCTSTSGRTTRCGKGTTRTRSLRSVQSIRPACSWERHGMGEHVQCGPVSQAGGSSVVDPSCLFMRASWGGQARAVLPRQPDSDTSRQSSTGPARARRPQAEPYTLVSPL
jgi:hypothetical protein